MNIYPHASSDLTSIMENGRYELPYTRTDLKILEQGLLTWMYSLGVLNSTQCPYSLTQVIHGFKSGVTLCDLVGVVFHKKVVGVFRSPKTEGSCISNIKKALDVVRVEGRMSRKFVWRED
jgi:hypothetical protein